MVVLIWGNTGERFYETGVDRGVCYPTGADGVAWNGLISVNETVSGGGEAPVFFEGNRVYNIVENEDFEAEISAFSAPAEFLSCDGVKSIATGLYVSQQPRTTFGFSYRTIKGNDTLKNAYGYKIHLVYNAIASPSTRKNQTLSTNSDPNIMTWAINTVPPTSTTFKPTAHLVVDVSQITSAKRITLENTLYGQPGLIGQPTLPSPAAVRAILL